VHLKNTLEVSALTVKLEHTVG